MKNQLIFGLLVAGGLALGGSAHAALELSPTTTGVLGVDQDGNNNCEPECIYTVFGISSTDDEGPLILYYKSDVDGGGEEGTFESSYSTTYNPSTDPYDATITWVVDTAFIDCPECYLAIKDGNADPNYYFYNLASWDGKLTIEMTGFWEVGQGSISHVSIWGREGEGDIENGNGNGNNVPEPGSLALLGLGLAGLAAIRRRKESA